MRAEEKAAGRKRLDGVQKTVPSVLGSLSLVASNKGLRGVFWNDQGMAPPRAGSLEGAWLDQAERELAEYLAGSRRSFDVPLDAQGTDFQKLVWRRLMEIPYGQTRSYQEIACELGRPGASRAVGTANGRNPLCIVIPCHRVIATDGSLGGYSGGLGIKTHLLALESGARF